MAHYAKIDENGVVETVLVADQDFIDTQEGTWIQTSYNTHGGKHYDPETGALSADQTKALRKNYAGIGYSYDSTRDAFIPPKPYPSWLLIEASCQWEAPLEEPIRTDEEAAAGARYEWDEATYQADNTQGWVLVGGGVD